jgi:hypothetical protein
MLLILGYVALVWFFTDMTVGRWLAMVGVGFAHFVLDRPILMGGLVVILVLSWLISRAFWGRHP